MHGKKIRHSNKIRKKLIDTFYLIFIICAAVKDLQRAKENSKIKNDKMVTK